jgi:hypothetical protein
MLKKTKHNLICCFVGVTWILQLRKELRFSVFEYRMPKRNLRKRKQQEGRENHTV